MGQTESLLNIKKDDWTDVILTALLVNYVLLAAHIPIWNNLKMVQRYSKKKEKLRGYLLNPKFWYDGMLWWAIFLFGAAWGIYRMLKILRESEEGVDSTKIYRAEIALLISGIQLGIHGFWAVPWFYWRQAFWSIFIMGVATLVAVGAYIPMLYVDPLTSGITYGVYIVAQGIFTIGNLWLFYYTFDEDIDTIKNPLFLYFNQKFYPIETKRPKTTKGTKKKKRHTLVDDIIKYQKHDL